MSEATSKGSVRRVSRLIANRREVSASGRPNSLAWLAALTAFALLFALIVDVREGLYGGSVRYWEIAAWQLCIWLPWSLAVDPLGRAAARYLESREPRTLLVFIAISIAILVAHIGFAIGVSIAISPLHGLPGTKYGVFAYFFILFGLVDLIILGIATARIRETGPDESLPRSGEQECIRVRCSGQNIEIGLSDIRWIGSEDYYSRIWAGRGSYLVRQSLTSLMEQLPPQEFVRIHRSAIINRSNLVETRSSSVSLKDGTILAMSRAGRKRLNSTR